MLLLILFTILCLVNLARSTRAAPSVMQRNQLRILMFATLIAGLTGPIEVITEVFSIGAPRVTLSILLGIAEASFVMALFRSANGNGTESENE